MARTNRGDHPDIDPTSGELKADAYDDPQRRAFNRMMSDPTARAAFMERLSLWQSRLPEPVQREIAGRTFAEGEDAFTGYVEYRAEAERWRHGYYPGDLTSEDVSNMTPAEYDAAFDERGVPREGYTFRATDRDTSYDSGMSPITAAELRNRGAQP